MTLRDLDLKTHYETGPDDLISDFYVPTFREATQYDRFASYFTSVSLAMIGEGLIEFVENGGTIRMVVNTELDEEDLAVLKGERETPTESLREIFDPSNADGDVQSVRWKVLAWLLDNDRLEIKVSTTPPGKGGIFHAKLGILRDDDDNIVTFEGSSNETLGGLAGNYEHFKVHTSWVDGHRDHIDGDITTFDSVWDDDHLFVSTYELPDALEHEIIKAVPQDKQELIKEADRVLPERLQGIGEPPVEGESDHAVDIERIRYAGKSIGGTHIAEEVSAVDPWPHQRIVSDTLYSTYPKGFLLCDEVGLGKTIEAGLTISRLVHTEEIQSCLILAPANLTKQWQEELWEKFNLNTFLYDNFGGGYGFVDALGREFEPPAEGDGTYAWESSPVWRFVHDRNANEEPVIVIASWHLARMTRHQDTFVPTENGTTRTTEDVPASCRGRDKSEREGVWDLTIVDEAHKARRRDFRNIVEGAVGTPNNLLRLLRDITDQTQCLYLLTATPMQIHSVELFDLLSVAGVPEVWNDTKRFLDFFDVRRALAEVLAEDSPEYTGEAKLEEGAVTKQQTLGGNDDVITQIAHKLEVDRAESESMVLQACELVRAYDRDQLHEVYPDELLTEVASSQNQRQVEYLIRDEDAFVGMADRRKRRQALENISLDNWHLVLRAMGEATPIDVILHRNTRDILREYHRLGLLKEDDRVPTRQVDNVELELDGASEVYDRIEEYVTTFYKRAKETDEEHVRTTGLVMTVYRQRMTSSFEAIRNSLESRLSKLERAYDHLEDVLDRRVRFDAREWIDPELLELDISPDEASEVFGDLEELDSVIAIDQEDLRGSLRLIEEEMIELESFIHDVHDLISEQDPKLDRLKNDIRSVNEQGRNRVMIFTQYGDTLDAIRKSLVPTFGSQVGCYSGRGGEMYEDGGWINVGKERVKHEFSSDDGSVEVLVCTEAASHGLNLQECGVLINYDLPWNPMRVEQRIGRIDRIGQAFEDIWIFNYFYEDTVEGDVYEALRERVGLFEEYVGGMQPIISNAETQIQQAAMEGQVPDLEEEQPDESYEHIRSTMEYKVAEDALLNGWSEYQHPDIGEISATPSYLTESPVTLERVEEILIEAVEESEGDFELIERFKEGSVYLLKVPGEIGQALSEHIIEPEEDTYADRIRAQADDGDRLAISFTPPMVDEYPSLRLLSFGDPLFHALVAQLNSRLSDGPSDQLIRITREGTEASADEDTWIVCGWPPAGEAPDQSSADIDALMQWASSKRELESMIN